MKAYERQEFLLSVNAAADDINAWAVDKGFWNIPQGVTEDDVRRIAVMKKVEKIALVASETVGEGLEAVRKNPNAPSEHIPEFTAEEEEMADAVIRILDYTGYYKLRLSQAIAAKMAFNEGRPYQHGKSF